VYVAGIPESLRSNYALVDFFQRSPWRTTVFEATVAMNIPKLEAKVAKREVVLQKLEHAMAEEKLKGKVKKHRTFQIKKATSDIKNISQTVESVQAFRKQLDDLNKSVSLEVGKVRNSNHRLRCNLAKQNADSNILRGRTLTREEILGDPDLECGLEWTVPSTDDSLNRQNSSKSSMDSVREPASITSDEIPEEDNYVSDVDIQVLPGIDCDVDQKESEGAMYFVQPIGSAACDVAQRRMPTIGFLSGVEGDEDAVPDDSYAPNRSASETGALEAKHRCGVYDSESYVESENLTVPSQDNEGSCESLPQARLEETVVHSPDEAASKSQDHNTNSGMDALSKYCQDATARTSIGSFKSSSAASLRCGRSDSKRASSSVRHLPTTICQTISKNVNVESVTEGVKKARDLSISGSKVVRDLGVKGSKTVVGGTLKATKLSTKVAVSGLMKAHHEFSENAAALAPILRIGGEGAPRPAGFVTFKNRYTTQAALQMLQHPSSTSMLIEEAPTPSEVFWRNVGLPDKARRTGSLLSFAATSTLCLFWSFPVAFISSLTEVNSLKKNLPRLGEMIEKSPALEMFFALLAPLLLLGLNEAVLPVTLKWFAQWEGHISSPRLEASLFRKLSAFQIIQTFFISTISGSLTAELANMIDNPEEIVQLLANTLPTQSSYFIQLMFVFTFFFHGLELLRVIPLGYALIRRLVGPNLTAKERQRMWKFLYSLEEPPSFWHAETFSKIVLFYVVFFVYSTISPITSVFLLGCFIILESGMWTCFGLIFCDYRRFHHTLTSPVPTFGIAGYRYLFIHNFPTSPDSGGRIWAGFVATIFAGILIGELTLIGLLLLNEAFYSVPALVPLVIITILFIIFVHPARMHVARHLPATTCLELDNNESAENNTCGDFDFLRDQYLQPALKQRLVFPDESSFTSRSSAG
jgi:hypothetical protein